MAVAYHTHSISIPTADAADLLAGTEGAKVVTPEILGPVTVTGKSLVNSSGGRAAQAVLGLNTTEVETIAEGEATDLSGWSQVIVNRYASGSLLCPALYRQVSADPGHDGAWQDSVGTWFEYVPEGGVANVLAFGAMVDGVTDDTAALTAALSIGAGEVVVEGGALGVSDTVIVPPGVKLRVLPGAKIVPLADIDVVRLHGKSYFEGTIDVTGFGGWNSAALLFDGTSEQVVANIFRLGYGGRAEAVLIGNTTGTGNGTAVKLLTDAKNATPSAISKTNPVEVTSVGHGFETGDNVYAFGIGGMTELNNRYFIVTKTGADTFTLNSEDGTGHTTFTSGGTFGLKTWLMDIHVNAAVTGFDKAVHLSDTGADSSFITCNVIDVVSTYSLQQIVMEAPNKTYGCDSNRIQVMSQSRPSAGQTEIQCVVDGQSNVIDFFPIDWVGGGGASVDALDVQSSSRWNTIRTNVSPSFINVATTDLNQIVNLNDPPLYVDEGNLYVKGASGSGKYHVYDANNATGLHVFRVAGGNKLIISYDGSLAQYVDSTHGVRHRVTSLTSVKNIDWPDAAGIPMVKIASPPSSATDTGVLGMCAEDDSYFYVCIGTNTWKRVALASW